MNWSQTPGNQGNKKVAVSVCETQPLVVAGLQSSLLSSGAFYLADAAKSLEDAACIVLTASPRVMIVDKAYGTPSILEWLARMTEVASGTSIVVWGSAMTESEALRYLKMGAKGIVRKTAEVSSVMSCLTSVANGSTWMEETLFREIYPSDRNLQLDLTPREQQVLELVEQGLRNKEIGRELGIRPGTVKIHLKHIFEKTGVRGRYGLALSGLRHKTAPQMLTV